MLFSDITIIDENFEVRENCYVGVRDGRIAYIGDAAPKALAEARKGSEGPDAGDSEGLEVPDAIDFGEIYPGEGKLLIPAFYNAHSHLPMVLLRGYGENLPLMSWLNDRIFPFEAKMTADDIYWACLYGVAEMLRYGIAGTSEMYIKQDPLGRAFLESGVKANFCVSVTSFDEVPYRDRPVFREARDAQAAYHGAGDGRLKTEFCIHAEYTNKEAVIRDLAAAAAENGSTIQVHVSETRGEVEGCRERHGGKSPVAFLAECGVFDVRTTAAHCVHVDADDISILREKGVTVATCPKSNCKLASGIAPIADMLAAGVNVAIGTDSVSSNNNLNMLEEMRFMNLLQKARTGDPTLITPAQTLYAATRAGALAQGREDCGLIKEGFAADLAVLDIDLPTMKPVHNLLNNLVYSAAGSDVVLTMVDGEVLYRDGNFPALDIERIGAEVETSRKRILSEL